MCQPKLSSARSNRIGACHAHITARLDDGRGDRLGQPAPQALQRRLPASAERPPERARQAPGEDPAGARRGEQQGRDEHDQLMLDHVHGEAALAGFVERRGERQGEHRPAARGTAPDERGADARFDSRHQPAR